LSIQGSKMSKSLKNFTTIREAISQGDWTPRGLRIVFLLGNWRDGLEITGEVVKAGVAWEEKLNSFFIRVRDIQQRSTEAQVKGLSLNDANEGSGSDLLQQFSTASQKFHDALCDSFDTPTAMRVISDLITAYNSASAVPETTSIAIAQWLTEQVHMFGLDSQPLQPTQLGWSGIDIPEDAKSHIYPLASLRDRVREQAIAGTLDIAALGSLSGTPSEANNPYAEVYADFQRRILELSSASASPKEYLAASDHLRDTALWNLSIYLEDREGQPSLVRPLSASLRQERADREKNAAAKAAAKEKAKRDAEAAEKERLEKGKLSQLEMFRTTEFSAWDAEGLPTADAEGKEVAKSRAKKLRKDWERQKKLHEAWAATQAK
jgi:cysteinyl-tRNA synthetase